MKIASLIKVFRFIYLFVRNKGITYTVSKAISLLNDKGLKGFKSSYIVASRDLNLPNNLSTNTSDYFNEVTSSYLPSKFFKDFEKHDFSVSGFQTKLICFYLPQFHPFKENDDFWGAGFTEWTNVTKSYPLFRGHNQPRYPKDLGYYDLRLPETLAKQAEIAKNYGIYGFCIHYYWFSGLKVMETPLNLIFANKHIDIKFCICWANENWTRRWDGNDQDILLKQLDHHDDYLKFITDIEVYFHDERYIRVNDCPMLVIYRAELLKDPPKASKIWKEYVKNKGFKDLHLVLTESFSSVDPTHLNFDAAVDFAPNTFPMEEVSDKKSFYHSNFRGRVFNYLDAVQSSLTKNKDYPFYKSICLEWDNTARKSERATILDGCIPEVFRKWLWELMNNNPLNNIIFINAWNEWAEGTYLEPDSRNGYAYLQKCYEVLNLQELLKFNNSSDTRFRSPKAIYVHIHYFDVYLEMKERLIQLANQYHFIFSVTDNISSIKVGELKADFPNSEIYPFRNIGRDILPFIQLMNDGKFDEFELVCKVHTKKSLHLSNGHEWGSQIISGILSINPINLELKDKTVLWALKDTIKPIKAHVGSNLTGLQNYNNWREALFVTGTMFWFRPDLLKEALKQKVKIDLFTPEPLPIDGTYAHLIERLMGYWIMEKGYTIESLDHLNVLQPYAE